MDSPRACVAGGEGEAGGEKVGIGNCLDAVLGGRSQKARSSMPPPAGGPGDPEKHPRAVSLSLSLSYRAVHSVTAVRAARIAICMGLPPCAALLNEPSFSSCTYRLPRAGNLRGWMAAQKYRRGRRVKMRPDGAGQGE